MVDAIHFQNKDGGYSSATLVWLVKECGEKKKLKGKNVQIKKNNNKFR